MKRLLSLVFPLFVLAFTAQAQTLTLTPSTAEVITSGAKTRTFYDIDDVFFITKGAAVEMKSALTNTTLFDGDTSEVTITGSTLWSAKLTKLATWCQDATTTTGYRYFLPRRQVQYLYTTTGGSLRVSNIVTKNSIWTGSIDSIKVSGVTGASNKLAWLRGKAFLEGVRHRVDFGDAATIAAGAAAGSSPTIAITAKGNCGRITLTVGSSPTTTGVLCTVTLPVTYPTGTFVTLTAGDADSGAHIARVFTVGSSASFTLNASGTALTAATEYVWDYQVIGY